MLATSSSTPGNVELVARSPREGPPARPGRGARRLSPRGTLVRVSTFEERRLARAAWPIRRVAIEDEELTDPRDTSTVDERIALVATLTRQQWAFAGLEVPTYTRAEMPGRLVRGPR